MTGSIGYHVPFDPAWPERVVSVLAHPETLVPARRGSPVSYRPRKKSMKQSKFSICKRCGGRIRKHIARCKKCSEKS